MHPPPCFNITDINILPTIEPVWKIAENTPKKCVTTGPFIFPVNTEYSRADDVRYVHFAAQRGPAEIPAMK